VKTRQDNERWRGCGPDLLKVLLAIVAVIGLLVALFGCAAAPVDASAALRGGRQPTIGVSATASVHRSHRLVMAGDSITKGGLVDAGDRLDVRLGYRLFGSLRPEQYGWTIYNQGVGGQQLLDQPTDLLNSWPALIEPMSAGDIIFVRIGTNDLFDYQGDAAWTAAYDSIVTQAQAKGIHVLIGEIIPLGASFSAHEDLRAQLNLWIQQHFGDSIVVHDSAVLHAPSSVALDPVYSLPDGIHPNAYGYMRMADTAAIKLLSEGWL
jgi:lysophospholipase L1-like esterase